MRTILGFALVLSIALSVMLLQMSGLVAVLGAGDTSGYSSAAELNETAENHSVGVEGSPQDGGDGDIVQFIVNGLRRAVDFVGLALLLPFEIENMGYPWYFAYPAGTGIQTLTVLGVAQWASNREWI